MPLLKSRGVDVAPNDDRYLSLRELSKYACMSVRTLRNHLARTDHPLPHFRMDGMILVKQSEFDAWMQQFRASRESISATVDELMEALR